MFLNDKTLFFYGAALFTIIPLFFSVFLSIYWVYRWRTMTSAVPQRIADYLGTYTVTLILFTVMGNFPSAVAFVQSKLLHHPMFSFSLTKRENDQLHVWKFVNTTLLEVHFIVFNLSFCFFFLPIFCVEIYVFVVVFSGYLHFF